jgi:hypothetical protein
VNRPEKNWKKKKIPKPGADYVTPGKSSYFLRWRGADFRDSSPFNFNDDVKKI